ncbi:MAG: DsbA family protein [Celeribacter sp.]
MRILPLAVSAVALGLAFTPMAQAQDFDPAAMTDDQRSAFRDEVRAYLLDNPEVLMEAIGVLESRQADAQTLGDAQMIETNSDAIFNDPMSYVGGNPDGDITIVEFMDYRCSYCRKAFPEVEELIATDGNIRFIVKEFPILGEESVLASRFAIAVLDVAGSDAYKNVHDALMQMRGSYTEASLREIAADAGIDEIDAVIAAMDSDEVTATIAANHELAQRLQITGTPTFVMSDQMLRGYVPLDAMQQIVGTAREG